MQIPNLKCLAALAPYIEKHQRGSLEKPDKRIEDGDVIVGVATPEIKALFGVHAELGGQHMTLTRELEFRAAALKKQLPKPSATTSFMTMVDAASSEPVRALAKVCDDISAQITAIAPLASFAQDLFWSEVRATFPELQKQEHLIIAAGWKVGYTTRSDDDEMDGGLAELLAGMRGRRR